MRSNLRTNARVMAMVQFLLGHAAFIEWWRDDVTARHEVVTFRVTAGTFHRVTAVTIEACLVTWSAARDCTSADNVLPFASLETLSRIAGVPGFGEAMAAVGWAEELPDDGGVLLPNFHEWNGLGKTSQAKSAAERSRAYRERQHTDKASTPDCKEGARHEPDVTASRDASRDGHVTRHGRTEQNRTEQNREEIPPPTPQGGVGGSGRKRQTQLSQEQQTNFDRWYVEYPRKEGKEDAMKAWGSLKPDPALVEVMIAAVKAQKGSVQWEKDAGQYIPLPASWLRGRRWEDDPPASGRPPGRIQSPAGKYDNVARVIHLGSTPDSRGSPRPPGRIESPAGKYDNVGRVIKLQETPPAAQGPGGGPPAEEAKG